MSIATFIASQLRKPSGWFGRHVVARILNRGNAPMNDLTARLLEVAPDDRILEVGFGGGDLIDRVAPLVTEGHLVGVDFSAEMTALCARRFDRFVRAGRLELRCADVDALPYPPGAFTKVCTVNTIYFWPNPLASLSELWRTLRSGGRIVVTFNPRETAQKLPYTQHGFHLYEPAQVGELLERAGFRDVRLVPGTTRLGPFLCAVGTR